MRQTAKSINGSGHRYRQHNCAFLLNFNDAKLQGKTTNVKNPPKYTNKVCLWTICMCMYLSRLPVASITGETQAGFGLEYLDIYNTRIVSIFGEVCCGHSLPLSTPFAARTPGELSPHRAPFLRKLVCIFRPNRGPSFCHYYLRMRRDVLRQVAVCNC